MRPCAPLIPGWRRLLSFWAPMRRKSRERLEGLAVSVAVNHEWEKGIGTSIRCGMRRLVEILPNADAVVLILCDQPRATAAVIRALVADYERSGARIVASEYTSYPALPLTPGPSPTKGRGEMAVRGVPARFDRQCFTALFSLADGEGAKRLIAKAGDAARSVPFPGGALDVDTPEDYLRLGEEPADA